jgi:GTP-binding protein
MPALPLVAIIGRPNSGKSTLFNALTYSNQAIVSATPGTTRDHVAAVVHGATASYLLIDTGGIGGGSEDRELERDVEKQSLLALERADLILLTFDCRSEMLKSDHAVVDILRKKKRRHVPVLLAVTKCERKGERETAEYEYHDLGIASAIVPVSAVQKIGLAELRSTIDDALVKLHFGKAPQNPNVPRIALVGKPNVGKSSIINALMSDPSRERSPRLISPIPGTTRDPSDTIVQHGEHRFTFVDTAGIRQRAKIRESIEELSMLRSIQAVTEATVTIVVIDAATRITVQDKRIARMALNSGSGLLLLLNKGDLLSGKEKQERMAEIRASLPFCSFAPALFCSAKTLDGLLKIFPILAMIHQNRERRIATKELQRWYTEVIQRMPARVLAQGKHVTQTSDIPPTFVLFSKNPKGIPVSYLRYLERSMRSTWAFEGTPIRWITKRS